MAKRQVKPKTISETSSVSTNKPVEQTIKPNALKDKLVQYYNELDLISVEEQNEKINKIKDELDKLIPVCNELNQKAEAELFKKLNKEILDAGFVIKRNKHGSYYHVKVADSQTGYFPDYKQWFIWLLLALGAIIAVIVMINIT